MSPYSNALIAVLQLVRHHREIDALALRSRREAEVIHRQALRRAPIDAQRAADAGSLIDQHYRRLRTQFSAGHFGELDVTVDGMNAIGRDHLDALHRADVDTIGAQDAAIAVDEDVELALQAALGLFEADRFRIADLCLDRGVAGVETAVRQRHRRHHLSTDAGVVVAPDQAPAGRRKRPLGDALGEEWVRSGDELGGDPRDLHLLHLRVDVTQILVDERRDPLALADRGYEVGRIDHVVSRSPHVRQLRLQVLVEHRDTAPVSLHVDTFQEPIVLALADGDEDHVAGNDELGTGDRFRTAAALVIGGTQLIADELDTGHSPLTVVDDSRGRHHVHDLDAFVLRFFQLQRVDRDLQDRPPVGHNRLFSAHAQHRAHAVHRSEATADRHYSLADPDVHLTEVDILQKLEAGNHTVQVLSRDSELLRNLTSGRDDHGVVGIGQLLEGDVPADLGVVADLDAEVGDQDHLVHDHVAGKAPFRHPRPHHAARNRVALVDGDPVSLASQVTPRGETVSAGPDDGRGQSIPGWGDLAPGFAPVIRGDPLQVADADRRVDLLAPAGVLTGAGAHAAEAAREDVVLPVELEGVGVAPVGDQRDVARDVCV